MSADKPRCAAVIMEAPPELAAGHNGVEGANAQRYTNLPTGFFPAIPGKQCRMKILESDAGPRVRSPV